MTLDKYERVWLTAVGGLIGSFMAALMVAYLIFDIRLPTFEFFVFLIKLGKEFLAFSASKCSNDRTSV